MRRLIDRLGWALAGAMAIVTVLAVTAVVSGGPLDPPGSPGSTDGVRLPGTPISAAGTVISQPGHYYLTRDITGGSGGQVGITIGVSDVTLDLNGFTMSGGLDSGAGIFANASVRRIVIRNGTVRGWGDFTQDGGGIAMDSASNSVVEDMIIMDNFGAGLSVASESVIRNNAVTHNTGDGIAATFSNLIEANTLIANEGDGIDVQDSNVIRYNRTSDHNGVGDVGIRVTDRNEIHGNSSFYDTVGYHLVDAQNSVYQNYYNGPQAKNIHPVDNDVPSFVPASIATSPFANIWPTAP